ncbi:MAG: hypothetical protein SGARI_006788, partial [Bacillariaceae sp.]
MIPVKLYPHALALIGGGSPLPASQAFSPLSNHSYGSGSNASTQSYGSARVKGRGGTGFLHNLLLLKQRQIRELTGPASVHGAVRQRNHLYSVPLGSGSGHRRRISRHSSWSSFKKKPASKNPTKTKIDPKNATAMFELLRTKPDLVEVGRSYQEKLERERLAALSGSKAIKPYAAAGSPARPPPAPKVRGKRTMSRS